MPSVQHVDLAVYCPTTREHLLGVLHTADGFHPRHTNESAEKALRCARHSPPHLLLLGTDLPDAPRQHTARDLRAVCPSLPVVAVGPREDEGHVAELLTEGLSGCVSRHDTPERVLAVLEAALQGEVRVRRQVVSRLAPAPRKADALPPLSRREWEVLRLLANGHDNTRIAAALHLSKGTVRNYVSGLYRRLGVASRVEAAQWAREHRLGGKQETHRTP